MTVILVTGMSGTGKSAALLALEERGYRVVDTDYGGWTENVSGFDGRASEPQWHEARIDLLIADHERSGEPLFIGGTVSNQVEFYPRFDEIVLLTAPVHVILDRVAHRQTNPFGKAPAERDRIAADTAEIEPLLRSVATVEINTCRPLSEVVEHLASLAGPRPCGLMADEVSDPASTNRTT
ncbi:AAA family ATPase [Nocardia testacea]|uniref:AAA family ATPase n=1 Tax=Nocardia testacea TaxID=248551 RepID=A0ABW7VX48_9NOCA